MLYQINNPYNSAMQGYGQAANTYSHMQRNVPQPGRNIGGALSSGVGGAMAGASLGGMMTTAGTAVSTAFPVAGAVLGLASYLLS